jgi:hypothetical protein
MLRCYDACNNWLVFIEKKQEFPAPLKLKAAFTSGTLVISTYKRELRDNPQDSNYTTFSKAST